MGESQDPILVLAIELELGSLEAIRGEFPRPGWRALAGVPSAGGPQSINEKWPVWTYGTAGRGYRMEGLPFLTEVFMNKC